MVVIGNGLAGAWALAAQRLPSLRTRALWWFTAFVEVAIVVQVILGVALYKGQNLKVAQFHMFYGFVAIIAVGLLYSYKTTSPWVRERIYLVYGLGSLFLMGLAIRAFLVSGR